LPTSEAKSSARKHDLQNIEHRTSDIRTGSHEADTEVSSSHVMMMTIMSCVELSGTTELPG
jgi:hypothetical protein